MGVFYFIQKQLRFVAQDRLGLFLTATSIFLSWYVFFYQPKPSKRLLQIDSAEIRAVQGKLDSLEALAKAKDTYQLYPFNPNFITDYKGYQLGMSLDQIDRLHAFRAKNKWINSVADFKRVTQMPDSLLATISPYFAFPDWVTNKKVSVTKKDYTYKGPKAEINLATPEQLEAVYGIGPTLSKRIIALRNRLQGFSDTLQLRAVYGLSAKTRQGLWERFQLKNPKPIKKIEFANASASDLATIPGIHFDLALKMVAFRRLRDSAVLPSQLLKIDGLSPQKLELITLYLQFN